MSLRIANAAFIKGFGSVAERHPPPAPASPHAHEAIVGRKGRTNKREGRSKKVMPEETMPKGETMIVKCKRMSVNKGREADRMAEVPAAAMRHGMANACWMAKPCRMTKAAAAKTAARRRRRAEHRGCHECDSDHNRCRTNHDCIPIFCSERHRALRQVRAMPDVFPLIKRPTTRRLK